MTNIERLKARVPEATDAELEDVLESAKSVILSRAFVNVSKATDEEKNAVSHRYNACKLLAPKLKEYIDILKIEGKLYMATIWECVDDQTTWIRKNAAWAKGRVTELNASLTWNGCKPQFYFFEH